MGLLGLGAWSLVDLVWVVTPGQWGETWLAAAVTLGRVLVSTALGTLWAVPAGLMIGLSPRLSRALQPLIQVLASFPAPMLFPLVIAVLALVGVPLNWGSILLMLLGTQWYILFNVVAGAMAIPADLRTKMARSYHTCRCCAAFPYPLSPRRLSLPGHRAGVDRSAGGGLGMPALFPST